MRYTIRVWNQKTGETKNKTFVSDLPIEALLESLRIGDKSLSRQRIADSSEDMSVCVTICNSVTGEVFKTTKFVV